MNAPSQVRVDESLLLDAMLDERHAVAADTAQWARAELATPEHGDRDARFATENWSKIADRGILALLVDPALGGQGADLATALLTMEGLGYGCDDAGLAFAASGHVWTVQPLIERFGSAEQHERFFPGLVDGTIIGSFAISEPTSGSDTFGLSTSAIADDDGDHFVVNGSKAWVTMGPVADTHLVFTSTSPGRGHWGVTALLVDAETLGLQVSSNIEKTGLRSTPFGTLQFTDAQVPIGNVLGRAGAGASLFSKGMELERGFMLAAQLGAMLRQLDRTADWIQTRTQAERTLASFQAVSHRLANMRMRYESARTQMYRTALAFGRGAAVGELAAMAKLLISESAVESSVDAIVSFGARGIVSEIGLERDLRDTVGTLILGGTSDVQRNVVADSTLRSFGAARMGVDPLPTEPTAPGFQADR